MLLCNTSNNLTKSIFRLFCSIDKTFSLFIKLSFKMDINHDVHEGLQLCGESVRVPEKSFKKLVEITFDIILGNKDETSFDGI